ncbi:PLP-dependent aminotransferase family protein [Tunicatimonas pelagia]|uniref:MocR-like pyridoxine biosynthesis transcription factor PdxR n=1 Tax=Tunicatimonas pelagia TaxID=931531 RepID=UPI0026656CD9|nr:PLP-dependent aminotransferase family protein [Tunicatimonas pelagia]WKN41271.1 PLP-dependent aminotransferase family protein [Tunicatimonas pelagia]
MGQLYPWKTSIPLDRQSSRPLYLQIVDALIREIVSGRLASEYKMPGTRYLASLLEVNRKTLAIAYDELTAQGWLKTVPAKGTFVSDALPKLHPVAPENTPPSAHLPETACFAIRGSISPFRTMPKSLLRITDGSPDVRLAPTEELYRWCRQVAKSANSLRYQDEQGDPYLREILAQYLRQTRGLVCQPEQLLITRGSQMGIFLAFKALLKPGDTVIVGEVSYPEANRVIELCQGERIEVPVDEQGLSTDAIETICQGQSVRALYITSHHHYPTTVTLSIDRRVKLLALAQQYGFAIVEDDYDYDFHYASSPLLPLASLDTQGCVIYLGSFTKCIAPAIRVGYLAAPTNFIQTITPYRRLIDRQGDPVMERALANWIEAGDLQRYIKKSLRIYRERRNFLSQYLQERLGQILAFQEPEGGMATWVRCNPKVDTLKLAHYTANRGVSLEGVEHWQHYRGIRLGFASLTPEELEQGMDIVTKGINQL